MEQIKRILGMPIEFTGDATLAANAISHLVHVLALSRNETERDEFLLEWLEKYPQFDLGQNDEIFERLVTGFEGSK